MDTTDKVTVTIAILAVLALVTVSIIYNLPLLSECGVNTEC